MKTYSVVWVPLSSLAGIAPWLPPKQDEEQWIYLPCLRNTEEEDIHFEVSPALLLRSIMLSYRDDAPSVSMADSRAYMREVLDVLASGFQQPDIETMLLSEAANIRGEYGNATSRHALMTAMELLPQSSEVRSDFILDTWCRIQNGPPENWPTLAESIVEVFPMIEQERVLPGAWQACVLFVVSALMILGRHAEAETMYKHHKSDLEDPEDIERMEWLLAEKRVNMDKLAQEALGCH